MPEEDGDALNLDSDLDDDCPRSDTDLESCQPAGVADDLVLAKAEVEQLKAANAILVERVNALEAAVHPLVKAVDDQASFRTPDNVGGVRGFKVFLDEAVVKMAIDAMKRSSTGL